MANIKSAKKRAHQNELHRQHNASIRSSMRTAIKQARKAIDSGDKAAATNALQHAYSVLDSTVGKGVVHKNMAARSKSRLAAAVKAMA